jgi:hypothetical protein
MRRPRILLVPHFSELDWRIKPLLEEWAQVASFDAPGVGRIVRSACGRTRSRPRMRSGDSAHSFLSRPVRSGRGGAAS